MSHISTTILDRNKHSQKQNLTWSLNRKKKKRKKNLQEHFPVSTDSANFAISVQYDGTSHTVSTVPAQRRLLSYIF